MFTRCSSLHQPRCFLYQTTLAVEVWIRGKGLSQPKVGLSAICLLRYEGRGNYDETTKRHEVSIFFKIKTNNLEHLCVPGFLHFF